MYVERIEDPPGFDEGGCEGLLAIIVYAGYSAPGCSFLTADGEPLQMAHMTRPAGFVVPPHAHYRQERATHGRTQEVLFVKRGVVELTVFTAAGSEVARRTLRAGDAVLLTGGGHGLEVAEDADFVEVKTGPYFGRARDKYDLPTGRR